MIFGPELVKQVLAGKKTVTRRRVIHRDGRPIRYTAGAVYAVQPGRGKPHVAHIAVRSVNIEPLQAITEEEARREGFANFGEFLNYWLHLHGAWNPGEEVARISFNLVHFCPDCSEAP